MHAVSKIKQSYLVLSALVLGAVVLPVAIAGAAGGGKPATTVAKSVKQLKKQVTALQQQVAAIQAQPGTPQPNAPQPPGGPAGGDLTGAFPNPLIAKDAVGAEEIKAGSVGSAEITDDSITAADIGENSIEHSELRQDSVGSEEIGISAVGRSEIANGSVGANEIGKITTAVSATGTGIGAGQNGSASVTCPGESLLVAGGFAWADNEASSIIYSTPSESNPEKTWTVRGFVPSGSNTLYAWASCLAL